MRYPAGNMVLAIWCNRDQYSDMLVTSPATNTGNDSKQAARATNLAMQLQG